MMQSYSYDFTVRLHDIDAAGVVFFAYLYRHAHDAYEAFMSDIGFSLEKLIAEKKRLPIVHGEADMQHPIRQGEKINVQLQIQRIGRSSFSVIYLFIDQKNRQRASVSTTHVHLDKSGQKSEALPETLMTALTQYLHEP